MKNHYLHTFKIPCSIVICEEAVAKTILLVALLSESCTGVSSDWQVSASSLLESFLTMETISSGVENCFSNTSSDDQSKLENSAFN